MVTILAIVLSSLYFFFYPDNQEKKINHLVGLNTWWKKTITSYYSFQLLHQPFHLLRKELDFDRPILFCFLNDLTVEKGRGRRRKYNKFLGGLTSSSSPNTTYHD